MASQSGMSRHSSSGTTCDQGFLVCAPKITFSWLKDIGADEKKLNPNGGAIALGHPLGGSGARLMTTLLYHMRDKGIRYGLQTMCEGGGQANATIVELL